jgi:hypothetical protein
MIRCLYANGDSWTEGDELGLPWNDITTPMYRHNNSWPKLLASQLNVPVCINEGMRGTSGARIFRKTARFMREWCRNYNGSELLVVVCWTTLERDELPIDVEYTHSTIPYYIPYHYYKYNMPHLSQISKVDSVVLHAMEKMHPLYTTTVGEESRAEMQYERMWNLQQIANSLNVKLIQCFALDSPHFDNTDPKFRQDWHNDLSYITKQFINFCRDRNLPLAPGGHCLEEGHQQWAEYIYEHVNNNFRL